MKQTFSLNFVAGELVETCFSQSLIPTPLRAVRGKSSGAFFNCGSFQWTSAVQALSVLFIRAAIDHLRGNPSLTPLSGERGSLAASLDYAIAKEPEWIIEMFGTDSKATPLIKRLVRLSNSNQKRPGPVAVSLNDRFFPASSIEIRISGVLIQSDATMENLIEQIEKAYAARRVLKGALPNRANQVARIGIS